MPKGAGEVILRAVAEMSQVPPSLCLWLMAYVVGMELMCIEYILGSPQARIGDHRRQAQEINNEL